MAIHASTECVEYCKVLNGCDAIEVAQITYDDGEPTGWVELVGTRGECSQSLIDIAGIGSGNEEYLITVRSCVGAKARRRCELEPYTYRAYQKRGEI